MYLCMYVAKCAKSVVVSKYFHDPQGRNQMTDNLIPWRNWRTSHCGKICLGGKKAVSFLCQGNLRIAPHKHVVSSFKQKTDFMASELQIQNPWLSYKFKHTCQVVLILSRIIKIKIYLVKKWHNLKHHWPSTSILNLGQFVQYVSRGLHFFTVCQVNA